MNSTWLYGIEVRSVFPLFAAPTLATTAAPGEHAAITLQAASAEHGAHREPPSGFSEQLRFQVTHGRQLTLHTDRSVAASAPGQPWSLNVEGVVRFHWRGGGHSLFYELQQQGSRDLMAFWFCHLVLPLQLTLERDYGFLHAAAVEVAGSPVLFVAPSTGGKSTLADHFLRHGHALLSDDKVATFAHEGQYWAAPSHPHHRPWREFEVLGQPVANFASQSNPIRAIYCLCAEDPAADIAIEALVGFRKFEQLLPHYLFHFDYLRARRLAWLARMAEAIPVYRVRRPWELTRMHETYLALCAHAASVG